MKRCGFRWTIKDSFAWLGETRNRVRSLISDIQNATGWQFIENAYAVVPSSNESSD